MVATPHDGVAGFLPDGPAAAHGLIAVIPVRGGADSGPHAVGRSPFRERAIRKAPRR